MTESMLYMLHSLSPVEFEEVTLNLVRKMGFEAEATQKTYDGGIDIIAWNQQPLLMGKYIIQCKRYSPDKQIGVQTVRELYGIATSNKANKAILISTSYFTKSSIEFAQENFIELIDGNKLVELLKEYSIKIPGVSDELDVTDIIISQLNAIIQESEKQTLSDDELAEHLQELSDHIHEAMNQIGHKLLSREEGFTSIDKSVVDKLYETTISQYISTLFYKYPSGVYELINIIRKAFVDTIRFCISFRVYDSRMGNSATTMAHSLSEVLLMLHTAFGKPI